MHSYFQYRVTLFKYKVGINKYKVSINKYILPIITPDQPIQNHKFNTMKFEYKCSCCSPWICT